MIWIIVRYSLSYNRGVSLVIWRQQLLYLDGMGAFMEARDVYPDLKLKRKK